MDAANFDCEGGFRPVREPYAQRFDGEFFETKASGIVDDELVENRSVEPQVPGDRLRIYEP